MKISYFIEYINSSTIVINDTSNINGGMTITNGVELLLQELKQTGNLRNKVYYYDTDEVLTEIIHNDGEFIGFEMYP